MYVKRNNLKVGDYIKAPGATSNYTYGSYLVCPKCGHKTIIFRPRKKLWVCYYKDIHDVKCGLEIMVYRKPRDMHGITPVDNVYGDMHIEICKDLVSDVLGDDLAKQHIEDICGVGVSGGKGRNKQSSFLPYDSKKMERYKRKYLVN